MPVGPLRKKEKKLPLLGNWANEADLTETDTLNSHIPGSAGSREKLKSLYHLKICVFISMICRCWSHLLSLHKGISSDKPTKSWLHSTSFYESTTLILLQFSISQCVIQNLRKIRDQITWELQEAPSILLGSTIMPAQLTSKSIGSL